VVAQIDPALAVVVVPSIIGAIVWLVRLEGRINTSDQRVADLKDDVSYIRDRIDTALNGRHD
jgi:hypothetical protein